LLPGEEFGVGNFFDAASIETDDDDVDDDDDSDCDNDGQDRHEFVELQTTIKLKERALLPPIGEGATEPSELKELETLRQQNGQLMVEKQKLADRLYVMRRAYDGRVGPFRDVFDDVSYLHLCTYRCLSYSILTNDSLCLHIHSYADFGRR
jgi:hypothetical protein